MMRTWEEKVKFKYGVRRAGDDDFEITVAGVPDDEANGVEDGFHTIPSFVPKPRPQPPNPIPNFVSVAQERSQKDL